MNKPIPFGKYYLLERINVGGMAEVFKAKAFGVEGFERLLAVKRILPNIAEDEEFITMFIDEAKIAVQLQHANVAQIFDLGKVDDSYFIALEYVHGRDLRAIFDHQRKLGSFMPTSQICYIMMQVCEGLDYAHNKRDSQGRELNLVHRDVSPQNILIGYEGEVKLVDFGIAKAAGKASKTQAGILKGKFGYMSPEQVRGLPVDRRSDIFSVGICLYEVLTNERLFIGESDFSTLEKVRNVEILPPTNFNRQIPAELERIVLKALAKDVEDRYQNAIDLHDDLQAFLYSLGELYSRKDLAAWMKRSFHVELDEENAKLEQFRHFSEPTPAPVSKKSGSRTGSGGNMNAKPASGSARRGGAAAHHDDGGLNWDEEELETQIFDRAMSPDGDEDGQLEVDIESADDEPEEAEALTSNDLYVGEPHGLGDADDKTVLGPPPEELLGELAGPGRSNAAAMSTLAGWDAPSPGSGSGPPPGLAAYRSSNGMGHSPAGGSLLPNFGAAAAGSGAPITAYTPRNSPAMSRQTMPYGAFQQPGTQPSPSHQQAPSPGTYPPRATLEAFAQRKSSGGKGKLIISGLLLVAAIAFGVWYVKRPGKLQLVITPADAEIVIDGVPVTGPSPLTIERPPGLYNIQVKREGYDEKGQNVDVEAGSFRSLDIQLKASALTGFELTSDPPGALVWLDGHPFLAGDAGQQVRTNFKARGVTPGRHVLEIKGDPRFTDWRYEFFQEPAKMLKIHAGLLPHAAGEAGKDVKPAVAQPKPSAEPVKPVVAAQPTRPAAAPKPVAAAPDKPDPEPAEPGKPAAAAEPAEPIAAAAPAAAATPPPVKPTPVLRPAAVRKVAQPRPVAVTTEEPEAPAAAAIDEAPKAAAAGGECAITVGSKPWSEVWIDGKNTGKITPLVDFKLPCGKHRVTLKNPDLKIEKEERIQIKPGDKFKKVFQLVDTEE